MWYRWPASIRSLASRRRRTLLDDLQWSHLYFKRAKSAEVLFGSPAAHRERIAGLIGMN